MHIHPKEKSILLSLFRSEQWKVLEKMKDQYIENISKSQTIKDSEWETLRATIEKEGKTRGVKEFFQEVLRSLK